KVASGAMNTHSRVADGRAETLCAHTALCGGSRELIEQIFREPATDGGVELLQQAGLLENVMASISRSLDEKLKQRAGEKLRIEALFFSNRFGILGQTDGAGSC
ncbi:MAG: cobalt-precorrin-6A synthase, partial [Oscillospiraceae bacterium]